MRIDIVEDRAGMEQFIRLPWSIYREDANWVPPLLMERRNHLNVKMNPFFARATTKFWLARRGSRYIGRISAQVDRAHLEQHKDATGQFGFLESEDESDTFAALFSIAEQWLRDKGMRRVRGPFSLSINDESGLLVHGFDTPPTIMMGHALPYFGPRVEELGYMKAKDLIAYDYDLRRPLTSYAAVLAQRVRATDNVRLRPLRMSRYAEELAIILDIFNDAWSDNWGFIPFSHAEMEHVAKEMRPLVCRDLVCIAEVDNVPAAMMVCLPNLNEAIKDLDGSLLPWGWARLLWRLKVAGLRTARVPLMGVRKKYAGTAFGAGLAFAVTDEVRNGGVARGFDRAELSWVLEDNNAVRRMIEAVGGQPYKIYRVYEKWLNKKS